MGCPELWQVRALKANVDQTGTFCQETETFALVAGCDFAGVYEASGLPSSLDIRGHSA